VRAFFAARPPLAFDLVRVAEFPGVVAYLVPEPDVELRALLRALWAQYPDYPPYGEPGGDPPPHATLGRLQGEHAITLALAPGARRAAAAGAVRGAGSDADGGRGAGRVAGSGRVAVRGLTLS
jgi:hypothetical protein